VKIVSGFQVFIVLLLPLVLLPHPAVATITPSIEADMDAGGTISVQGRAQVSGFEASLIRAAIDSPVNLPDLGLLGTGNGDKNITANEATAYAQQALNSGLVKKVFEKDIIYLAVDSKEGQATLIALAFEDIDGPTSANTPINVTFLARFEFDLQKKENHVIGFAVNYANVTTELRFTTPKGWTVESTSGLDSKTIVNAKKETQTSTVSGNMAPGTHQVGIVTGTVKSEDEGGICCLLLILGSVVIIILIVYFVRRRKKAKLQEPVQYAKVGPDGSISTIGATETVQKKEAEKRLARDERTFGKEYFKEDKKKGGNT
jgi:hypothetical protein